MASRRTSAISPSSAGAPPAGPATAPPGAAAPATAAQATAAPAVAAPGTAAPGTAAPGRPRSLKDMESPLLTQAGAVPAQGPDAGVAAHYGDPFAEQRALARSAGVVDRSHHGVLRITGADRLSWLHSLTTQDTEHLAPGETTQALVLSPNGHIEHHLTLTDDGSAVWAYVEPGTAGPLLSFLESMRFLLRVDPVDVTEEFALLTLMGPDAASGRPDGTAVTLADSFGMDVLVARDRIADVAADLGRRGVKLAGVAARSEEGRVGKECRAGCAP